MVQGFDVDLVVVGSGGAGMAAAITARRAGKEVLVIERDTIGGTCVNIGCVPSKTLLAAAGTRQAALTNPFPGVPTSAARSEEHTSELQSRGHLVCRLLLEKKKNNNCIPH